MDITKASLHKFKVDFISVSIIVSVADNLEDAIGKVDPRFIDDQVEHTYGMTITGDEAFSCFIVLNTESDINTIVHECVHAVIYTLDYHSLHVSADENEIMAYMMGYFVDCCIDAIEEHKKLKVEEPPKKSKGKKVKKEVVT